MSTTVTEALLARHAADLIEALARQIRDLHYPTYLRLRETADAAHEAARALGEKETDR